MQKFNNFEKTQLFFDFYRDYRDKWRLLPLPSEKMEIFFKFTGNLFFYVAVKLEDAQGGT